MGKFSNLPVCLSGAQREWWGKMEQVEAGLFRFFRAMGKGGTLKIGNFVELQKTTVVVRHSGLHLQSQHLGGFCRSSG